MPFSLTKSPSADNVVALVKNPDLADAVIEVTKQPGNETIAFSKNASTKAAITKTPGAGGSFNLFTHPDSGNWTLSSSNITDNGDGTYTWDGLAAANLTKKIDSLLIQGNTYEWVFDLIALNTSQPMSRLSSNNLIMSGIVVGTDQSFSRVLGFSPGGTGDTGFRALIGVEMTIGNLRLYDRG